MHRQIKVVAILMMVEGGLETLMSILLIVMGPVMMSVMKSAPSHSGDPPPELFGGIYIGMGVILLISAVLKIVAGIRNISLKGRVLGFVGLASSLLSLFSCYCIPTALGVSIYGLIVYLNQKSGQAFQMAESGMPAEQVLAQLDAAGYPGQFPPPQYPPPPGYPPQYPGA